MCAAAPRIRRSGTTALGVTSFRGSRAEPETQSGAPPDVVGGGEGDSAEDKDMDEQIRDLRRQAEELEELLRRTATLTSRREEVEVETSGIAGIYDPFDLDFDGGKIIVPSESAMTATASAVASDRLEDDEETQQAAGLGFLDGVWGARILVIVAAALYGTNFSVVKILDETMPVGLSSTLRFAMAALVTLPWLLAPSTSESNMPESKKMVAIAEREQIPGREMKRGGGPLLEWWRDTMGSNAALAAAVAGFEVGLWNSIGYIAQAVGLETTEAGKSAFICSLAVVVVPIIDFFAGKKFLPRELIGAALAVGGVGLLEFGGDSGLHALTSGDLASLIQPLAFGVGFWRMEEAMRRHPDEATRATAGQMMAVFVASAAYCLLSASSLGGAAVALPPTDQVVGWLTDPSIVAALLWTGVVTTALTVYMETLALKTLSAAETTMIFSTEPLWGAAFAAAVLGERFGLGAALGAGLILAGIGYSNVGLDWLPSSAGRGKEEEEKDKDSTENACATKVS